MRNRSQTPGAALLSVAGVHPAESGEAGEVREACFPEVSRGNPSERNTVFYPFSGTFSELSVNCQLATVPHF